MLTALLLAALPPVLAEEAPPIVNGQSTSDWPAVGALLMCYGNSCGSFCSGTLIDERWVLTAAHCIEALDDYARYGYTMKFGIGSSSGNIQDSDRFIRWHSHPQYSSWSLANDIGVAELEVGITSVAPMPINEEPIDNSWKGVELSYVGYGVTSDNRSDGGVKRFAEMPVYSFDSQFIYSRDTQDGQNICYGDSGGAALEEVEPGIYELAGVNSHVFGVLYSNYMCEGGGSGVARVDAYLDWILQYAPDAGGYVPEPEPEPEPEDAGDGAEGAGGEGGALRIDVEALVVPQGGEALFKVEVDGDDDYLYFIYEDPREGAVEVELDGWMRFIAPDDYSGEDDFTVLVVDEDDNEHTETVSVEILPREGAGGCASRPGGPGGWLALLALAAPLARRRKG